MTTLDEQLTRAENRFRRGFQRGPTDLRWDVLPPQVGDPAPDIGLVDHEGTLTSLSEAWRDRPALVVFWRHFGCGCGLERASRLREEHRDLVGAGGNVVIVGMAEPERAAAYRDDQSLPCTVLCDPSQEAYRSYGLHQGTVAQVMFDAPEPFWHLDADAGDDLMVSRREGGRPLVDDPWMLPGEFVVSPDGTLRLTYRYQYCEDFPDARVLTTAIRLAAEDQTSGHG